MAEPLVLRCPNLLTSCRLEGGGIVNLKSQQLDFISFSLDAAFPMCPGHGPPKMKELLCICLKAHVESPMVLGVPPAQLCLLDTA